VNDGLRLNSVAKEAYAISVGYENGPGFRGTRATANDHATFVSVEYSSIGVSCGLTENLGLNDVSSQTELFGTYSYPLRWIDLSTGCQAFLNVDTGHRDSFELLIEARTRPIFGVNFFLGHYLEVTNGGHNYLELKASHRFDPIHNKFAFEPYAAFGCGDYYTDQFKLTHAQFGVDSEWRLSRRFALTIYGAAVKPLDGARAFSHSHDVEGLFGVRLALRLP
jgi:hypothetical protein